LVAARACVRFEALTYTSKAACDAANDRASAAVFWRSWASDDTLRKVLDEFVYVPRYDLQETAAGLWPDDEKAKFTMAFRRYWVENYLHARPEDLSVLRVHGDSMYPVLHDGDNILINHAFTSPQDGIVAYGETRVGRNGGKLRHDTHKVVRAFASCLGIHVLID
jgi:phage repressor protein C with HTH and peptisase S24 domain